MADGIFSFLSSPPTHSTHPPDGLASFLKPLFFISSPLAFFGGDRWSLRDHARNSRMPAKGTDENTQYTYTAIFLFKKWSGVCPLSVFGYFGYEAVIFSISPSASEWPDILYKRF